MNYPAPLAIETTSTHGSERAEELEMPADAVDPIERWTAQRRVALVGSILKGETSVAETAGKHGLTVAEVEDWGVLLGTRTSCGVGRGMKTPQGRVDQKAQSEDRRSRARQGHLVDRVGRSGIPGNWWS